MDVKFTTRELSQKYDRFAQWYDWVLGILELLGVRRMRRQLLRHGSGKILEVAVGTGKNLRFYPPRCRVVAVDASGEMLKIAGRRAARLSTEILFLLADAEALPFSDHSFDTVVSSLSTCTFPNPVIALQEMARVCRADGRVLLLEHGRSNREWLARWQDRREYHFAKQLGCHWNRQPLELVGQAGVKVNNSRRVFFGVFHTIDAEPGAA